MSEQKKDWHGRTCGECAWLAMFFPTKELPEPQGGACRRIAGCGEEWLFVNKIWPACPAFEEAAK